MGKDKKKKKGSGFGYLLILLGLVAVALGVSLMIPVEQVTEIAQEVPVLQDHLGDENVRLGITGGGAVALILGWLIRPRKPKK